MAVTRAWKVYGAEGHRQREAFGHTQKFDSSKDGKTRIVECLCYDKTGTHDYAIMRITRDTAEECQDELDVQLEDGWFENSCTGKIIEIPADEPITQKAVRKILCSIEINKYKAEQFKRIEDVYDALLLEDALPKTPEGNPYTGTEAKAGADNSMDDVAEARVFENKGIKFLQLSMTFLEYFTINEDGDFYYGSDYERTADFSDKDKEIIKEFCGF